MGLDEIRHLGTGIEKGFEQLLGRLAAGELRQVLHGLGPVVGQALGLHDVVVRDPGDPARVPRRSADDLALLEHDHFGARDACRQRGDESRSAADHHDVELVVPGRLLRGLDGRRAGRETRGAEGQGTCGSAEETPSIQLDPVGLVFKHRCSSARRGRRCRTLCADARASPAG
jgi:hypothetical protein